MQGASLNRQHFIFTSLWERTHRSNHHDSKHLPWGYVDMVLASMRFPDLSLVPYKRDSRTENLF